MWVYNFQIHTHYEKLEEETPNPIITIQVGEERLVTQAFIDSGVDRNTMSYESYKNLKGV